MHPDSQNGADEQVSEIELNTDELVQMKPVPANSATFIRPAGAQVLVHTKAEQNTSPRARAPRAAFVAAAFAVTAIAAILYSATPSPETASHIAWPKLSLAKSAAEIESETQEKLVLVRNPFDKTEVFEFPAGTSMADARAEVADMLLRRAQQRQTLFAANGKR